MSETGRITKAILKFSNIRSYFSVLYIIVYSFSEKFFSLDIGDITWKNMKVPSIFLHCVQPIGELFIEHFIKKQKSPPCCAKVENGKKQRNRDQISIYLLPMQFHISGKIQYFHPITSQPLKSLSVMVSTV